MRSCEEGSTRPGRKGLQDLPECRPRSKRFEQRLDRDDPTCRTRGSFNKELTEHLDRLVGMAGDDPFARTHHRRIDQTLTPLQRCDIFARCVQLAPDLSGSVLTLPGKGQSEPRARLLRILFECPLEGGRSHVVIATFEPLRGKETVEVLGWQKRVLAVCG